MQDVILISLPQEKLEQLIQNAVQKALSNTDEAKEHNQNELLTRKEAANYLNVSVATIDNWTRIGKIIKHYNGTAVRFKKSELESSFTNLLKYKRG